MRPAISDSPNVTPPTAPTVAGGALASSAPPPATSTPPFSRELAEGGGAGGLFPGLQVSPLDDAWRILTDAVEQFRPFAVFSGFSGGDDSLAAAKFASQHPLFGGCFHANTQTGIRETLEFVRRTCMRQRWPLHEHAGKPGTYERMVLKGGFPGPALHNIYYRTLKERRLREFLRDQKRGRKRTACMVLVTGVRSRESRRRMGTTVAIKKMGSVVWVAPLIRWEKSDVLAYTAGMERNPVSEKLGMSGECLCGCFAQPGELDRIGLHFPADADRIAALESEVAALGLPAVWDGCPRRLPRPVSQGQMSLASLCVGCELRHPNGGPQ